MSSSHESSGTPAQGIPTSPPPPAYAPPAPGHLGAVPPGYTPSPPVPSTGGSSWGLGFLAYIPIPIVSMLIAAIAMICAYPSTRRKGVAVATENARYAANWGLTILVFFVASAAYMVGLFSLFPEAKNGFLPGGWPFVGFVLLCVLHLVVTIMGTLAARRGDVFRNALGISFLRRR